MLCCQFLCHVLKAIFFIAIALKLSFFAKKMQNFLALGAALPDPRTSGGWGLCSQPPTSGGWGHRPQTPIGPWRLRASPRPQNSPPHCKFLATHLVINCSIILMFWGKIVQVSQYIAMFVRFYCYLSSAVTFYSFIFL